MIKIDLGCGEYKKEDYIGIDILAQDIDILADVQKIPIRDNVVDRINMDQVMEHLGYPLACIRECSRISKRFCELTVSIPNIMNLRRFLRWMLKGKTSVAREHISCWGLPEIIHFCFHGQFKYLHHYFETHSRYHKLSWIDRKLKKYFKRIVDKNLVVVFVNVK